MKISKKLMGLAILIVTVSVVFLAVQKRCDGDLLSIKNVEALADGEAGWEKCVEVRGSCLNADGTVWTDLLNVYRDN